MMELSAVLTPAAEGGYIALNPETGTTTQGETVEAALANLREATELYLEVSSCPPTVNIQEVQSQFPHFVAEAEAGQEIIIARGGKPVARLVALVEPPRAPRPLGLGKPEFAFPENFDPLHADDIADLFQSGA